MIAQADRELIQVILNKIANAKEPLSQAQLVRTYGGYLIDGCREQGLIQIKRSLIDGIPQSCVELTPKGKQYPTT